MKNKNIMTIQHLKLAKCGCDCENCPTSKNKLTSVEIRKKCSAGWEKYLGIKLSPEKLRACDGCSIPDSKRKTIYLNCKIRKCAVINDMDNCAYCKAFPCDELLNAHSVQKISGIEDFICKTGNDISVSDFEFFVKPYMGLHHLGLLRKNIKENEIKDFKKHVIKTNFIQQKDSNNILYNLITSICIEKNISYARLVTLENLRGQILKIIWVAALYGTHNEKGLYLEVNSKTFSNQKINCMLNTLQKYFEVMKKYDIHCAIIPTSIQGWLTPMGGLRKEGWVFRLSFGSELNGNKALTVLKDIASHLNENYKEKAFRMFCNGEFQA